MNPKLSVIIPSYNHAAFIGDGIRSILEQSFQDFEILITDDASQDNSVVVIRQFSDPRISLEVFPRNRGFSAALNAAIKRSRGELISVLGSDDYFLPGTFRKQIEVLSSRSDIAAVFGMPKVVDQRGAPLRGGYGEFTNPFPDRTPSRKDWLRHFFFKQNCLCHPSVMIRRSVHDEVGLYDPRLLGLADQDMWVRVCMRHEILLMPDELVARRILDGGRNLSAPRPETNQRIQFERTRIARHYRAMLPEFAREVFANDLRALGLDTNRPFGAWLAELALAHGSNQLNLFALETLFETCATAEDEDECKRLIELTGKTNVFNIELLNHMKNLLAELDAVQNHFRPQSQPGPRATTAAQPMAQGNIPMDQSNAAAKLGRNELCHCGSGRKYKHCHGRFVSS